MGDDPIVWFPLVDIVAGENVFVATRLSDLRKKDPMPGYVPEPPLWAVRRDLRTAAMKSPSSSLG